MYVCVCMYVYTYVVYMYNINPANVYSFVQPPDSCFAFLPIRRRLLSIKMHSFETHTVIHCPTLSKGSVPHTFV
jgi:hypothetical protein